MIKAIVTRKRDCTVIELFTEKEHYCDTNKLELYRDFVRFGSIIADKCILGNCDNMYSIDCKNGIIFYVNDIEVIKDDI